MRHLPGLTWSIRRPDGPNKNGSVPHLNRVSGTVESPFWSGSRTPKTPGPETKVGRVDKARSSRVKGNHRGDKRRRRRGRGRSSRSGTLQWSGTEGSQTWGKAPQDTPTVLVKDKGATRQVTRTDGGTLLVSVTSDVSDRRRICFRNSSSFFLLYRRVFLVFPPWTDRKPVSEEPTETGTGSRRTRESSPGTRPRLDTGGGPSPGSRKDPKDSVAGWGWESGRGEGTRGGTKGPRAEITYHHNPD